MDGHLLLAIVWQILPRGTSVSVFILFDYFVIFCAFVISTKVLYNIAER